MELNREKIIKALECCANGGWCNRDGCPFYKDDEFGDIEKCTSELTQNAFALVKELTEENERLENALIEQSAENVMLIGENKRLRACTNLIPTLNEVKADTVREMQERLKYAPIKVGLPLFGLQTKDEIVDYANELLLQIGDAIDQIAKEMLEGNNENND